ncbi:MAG: 6-bladed beta-propeller, partial [Balneolaceae bacterium]
MNDLTKQWMVILWAIFLTIGFSCTDTERSAERSIFTTQETPYPLAGQRILTDEMGLVSIKKVDGLYILSTQRDTVLHVYDDQFRLISSFGRRGRGPGEFMREPRIHDTIGADNETKVLIYDDVKRKIIEFNLHESIENGHLNVSREFDFPPKLSDTHVVDIVYTAIDHFFGVYDDRFSKALDERRGRYYFEFGSTDFELINLMNLTIDPFEDIPEINLNIRFNAISPDRKRFVSAFMYHPRIEIFETVDHDSPAIVLTPEVDVPEQYLLDDFNNDELIVHHAGIYATEKYIYLLHVGVKRKDRHAASQRIQVMDWQGHLVIEFEIDPDKNINRFIVDEQASHIVGL